MNTVLMISRERSQEQKRKSKENLQERNCTKKNNREENS